MALLASLRSTIAYQTTGSTISTGAIYQTVSGGVPVWSNALVSSMVSIGTSTNQVYTTLTQGNVVSSVSTSSWVSSLTNRLSTTTVAMSANAQYQMTVSPSTMVSSIMYTSTLGQSWSTLSGVTGLPNPNETSYTAGAISGTGQYGVVGTSAGQLYVTSTFGQSFTGPSTNVPYVYLPFEGSTADQSGINRTVTPTGTFTYGTGIVGMYSAFFNNTSGNNTASFTIAVPWPGAPNFTITGWFNATSFSSGGFTPTIFATYTDAIKAAISNTGVLTVIIPSNGSQTTLATSSTLSLNTWYNYTFIFQTNGLCSFYLNNALLSSATNVGGTGSNSVTPIYLGSIGTAQNPFIGYMDNITIYTTALPFTSLIFPIVPIPSIYLPLDTVPANSSQSSGSAPVTLTVVGPPTDAPSYIVGSGAVRLTNAIGNATQYITGPISSSTTETVSISGWFNMQDTFPASGTIRVLLTLSDRTNNPIQIIYANGVTWNGTLYTGIVFYINSSVPSANTVIIAGYQPNITLNTWYNFALTYQNNALCSLYINNILTSGSTIGTQLNNSITTFGIGGALNVGGASVVNSFSGYIDDIKFYKNTILIPTQFLTLPSPPTIYLPFDTALTPTSTSQGSAPVTITTVGSPALSTTIFAIGSGSVYFNNNTPGAMATQYSKGPWTTVPNFTVSFWCNLPVVGQGNVIFSIGNIFQIQTNNLFNLELNAPGISVSTSYVMTINTWYNITIIYQANSTCYFYVNNVLIASPASSGVVQSITGTFTLAAYDQAASNASKVYIDDFRFYNTAIPFATLFSTSTSVPVVYLPLDTVPTDSSSSSGTIPAILTVVGPPTQAPSYVIGTGAIRLANTIGNVTTSQYIRGLWSGAQNFTVSLWFNTQSSTASVLQQTIFSAYGTSISIAINTSNQLSIAYPSGVGAGQTTTNTSFSVSVGIWYNIVLIFQTGSTCYLYANNLQIASFNNVGIGAFKSFSFGIGTFDVGAVVYGFNGYIDDVKIYNAAIPFTPMFPSQSFTSTAVSNSGQYMLATMANQGLYMSSNFGSSWTQITNALISALWSSTQVSSTGQYMLAYAAPVIVQPQLTGLTAATWQSNGIIWTASASTSQGATTVSYLAFNNAVGSNNTWASAGTYTAATGVYTGTVSTFIVGTSAYSGEWLQIQSSAPIVMYSYSFACGGNAGGNQAPRIYRLVGSNDGTTWYTIQTVTVTGNPYTAENTYTNTIIVNSSGTITGSNGSSYAVTTTEYTTGAYLYVRLCINATIGGSFGAAELGEWVINFQAGGQTYSTNYGSSWSITDGSILSTQSLSESGQYILYSKPPNALFTQLNFENNYIDTGNGGLPPGVVEGTTGSITFVTSRVKVGTYALYVNNNTPGLGGTVLRYSIPSNHLLSSTSFLTISLWVYNGSRTTQPGFFQYIFNSIGLSLFYLQTTLRVGYSTTQQSGTIILNPSIIDNAWVHIAITFGNGSIITYRNGTVINTTSGIAGTLTSTNLFIGRSNGNFSSFNGYIDDFRIYNRVLSASLINYLYLLTPELIPDTIPTIYTLSNYLQNFTTNNATLATINGTPLGTENVPIASAISNMGQYMLFITNNTVGNNIYYSMNYGATFTGIQVGTQVLTSCAISYDGSYITILSGATVYTLNNNSIGFSVALGNQAGYQNQALNSIAIGNYAGYQNQTANSIILNAAGQGASGLGLNSYTNGFYVAPIAFYTASVSQTFSILGYGLTDNQVVQSGITMLSNNNVGIGITNPVNLLTVGAAALPSTSSVGITNLVVYGNIACYRNRLCFSNVVTDYNHCIYNNGYNLDNEGVFDGMKFNVYNGAWFRVGNAALGTVPTTGLFIDSAGKVGIGKTNPSQLLDVNGAINCTSFLVNGTAVATGTGSVWGVNGSTAYYTSGSVGIGTISPSGLLNVYGTSGVTATFITNTTTSGYAQIFLYSGGNPGGGLFMNGPTRSVDGGTNTLTLRCDAGDLKLAATSDTSFIYLKSSTGTVGIGTTDPLSRLHVYSTGATGLFIATSTSANQLQLGIAAGAGNYSEWAATGDSVVRSQTANLMLQSGSGSAAIYINTSNNVGIKTPSPSASLEVVGSGGNGAPLRLVSNSAGNEVAIGYYRNPDRSTPSIGDIWVSGTSAYGVGDRNFGIGCNTTGCIMSMLASNGNVGIGTANPSAKFHVNSTSATVLPYMTSCVGETYGLTASSKFDYAPKGTIHEFATNIGAGINTAILFDMNAYNSIGSATNIFFGAVCGSGAPGTSANFVIGRRDTPTSWVETFRIDTTGNVGIGTNNPTSKLQINGSLAKSSGTFDIAHPLHPTTKRLVHSFIEGPRCDLIYRGTVALTNGVATVDINKQCTHNEAGAMEHGTFEALCANPDVFLQNKTGFSHVIGTVQGGILTITCENSTANDLISWMVVAERMDPFIKQWDRTDSDGFLITEYTPQ